MYCLTRKSKRGKEKGYLDDSEKWVNTNDILKIVKKNDETNPNKKLFVNKKEAIKWLKENMDETIAVSDLEDEEFIYKAEKVED